MPHGTDMDSVVVRGNTSQAQDKDLVKFLEYPKVKGKPAWVTLRLFGPVYSKAGFWVKAKRYTGNKGKAFFKICRCYDTETHQIVADKYDPFYDEWRRERDENIPREEQLLTYQRYFYMQAIVRKLQDNMPAKNKLTANEKKSGFKEMESDSYTPVVVVRLTASLLQQIQDMKEDNVVKFKTGKRTAYSVNHEKYGRDIMIRFDDSDGVAPSQRYAVKLVVDGGRTPLTDEEKAYLKWDMEQLYPEEESEGQIRRDFESWAKRIGLTADEDDEDDDRPKARKPKAEKKKKVEDDFDEESDTDDTDGDDDFDDEPPKKSKSKPAKKKKVEDDDFDEDESEESEESDEDESDDSDDDFDDDEDEPPFEEKKPKSKSSKKKVEEEDEDDFDEDDFDDEPPKKSKSKPAKKKKAEEDDDDFEDDDEEW